MSSLAPWLVGMAFFLVLASVLSIVACLTRPLFRKIESATLRAVLVAAPALIALVATWALLVPVPIGGCHCASHPGHHPHVCFTHPELSADFLLTAMVVVGAWWARAIARITVLVRDIRSSFSWSTRVRAAAPERVDGRAMHLVHAPGFGAFSVGALRPLMACDGALWARLSKAQRRAIVLHEEAHVERRDCMTLIALRIAVTITPLAGSLLEDWRAAAERACDRHAAMIEGDPISVAECLIGCAQTQQAARASEREIALAPGAALGDLEGRVRALLAMPGPPARRAPIVDILWVFLFGVALCGAAIASPGHRVHDAVETAMGGGDP